jgi:hypothetical protein
MHPNTGEIVEVPEDEMKEIEEAFEAQVDKIRQDAAAGAEGAGKVMEALGLEPAMVPIPPLELEKVRKMNKGRRKAWAKAQLERRVRRKRERKARKAGKRARSR